MNSLIQHNKRFHSVKADILLFISFCLISGFLLSFSSCKILKCNKKSNDDVKKYKEQPALYGTPVSDFKNNSQP